MQLPEAYHAVASDPSVKQVCCLFHSLSTGESEMDAPVDERVIYLLSHVARSKVSCAKVPLSTQNITHDHPKTTIMAPRYTARIDERTYRYRYYSGGSSLSGGGIGGVVIGAIVVVMLAIFIGVFWYEYNKGTILLIPSLFTP
jgi:hypothetical protein